MNRCYFDWNASAPLRPEARAAMLSAMDAGGNPSSQHAEGRAARAVIETARAAVAALVDVDAGDLVFTSGATEAANLAIKGRRWRRIALSGGEHPAVAAAAAASGAETLEIALDGSGQPNLDALRAAALGESDLIALHAANGETGIAPDLAEARALATETGAWLLIDATQAYGKIAFSGETPSLGLDAGARGDFEILSAHKFGGPRGAGALVLRRPIDLAPLIDGGGQELRRRSGTEAAAALAGFGAAATALLTQGADGLAAEARAVRALRNRLEAAVAEAAPRVILLSAEAAAGAPGRARLANTAVIAQPGWRAETQLMQFDLGGFAVSAGSACSSGKMATSPVLAAMGVAPDVALGALRVSLGPSNATPEIDAFVETYGRLAARAAAKTDR